MEEKTVCVSIMFNLCGNPLCPGFVFPCVGTFRIMLDASSPIPALMPSWGKSNLSDCWIWQTRLWGQPFPPLPSGGEPTYPRKHTVSLHDIIFIGLHPAEQDAWSISVVSIVGSTTRVHTAHRSKPGIWTQWCDFKAYILSIRLLSIYEFV